MVAKLLQKSYSWIDILCTLTRAITEGITAISLLADTGKATHGINALGVFATRGFLALIDIYHKLVVSRSSFNVRPSRSINYNQQEKTTATTPTLPLYSLTDEKPNEFSGDSPINSRE